MQKTVILKNPGLKKIPEDMSKSGEAQQDNQTNQVLEPPPAPSNEILQKPATNQGVSESQSNNINQEPEHTTASTTDPVQDQSTPQIAPTKPDEQPASESSNPTESGEQPAASGSQANSSEPDQQTTPTPNPDDQALLHQQQMYWYHQMQQHPGMSEYYQNYQAQAALYGTPGAPPAGYPPFYPYPYYYPPPVPVDTQPLPNRTLFVGNLSPTVTQQTLEKVFGAFGALSRCRLIPDKNYGFVSFYEKNEAAVALSSLSGMNLEGRPLRCSWGRELNANEVAANSSGGGAMRNPPTRAPESENPNTTTLFLGNLSPIITEQQITSLFAPFGKLTRVKVNEGKHYGFVSYDNRAEAEMAIQHMRNYELDGRVMRVSWGH